jgi:hypothetical protein
VQGESGTLFTSPLFFMSLKLYCDFTVFVQYIHRRMGGSLSRHIHRKQKLAFSVVAPLFLDATIHMMSFNRRRRSYPSTAAARAGPPPPARPPPQPRTAA